MADAFFIFLTANSYIIWLIFILLLFFISLSFWLIFKSSKAVKIFGVEISSGKVVNRSALLRDEGNLMPFQVEMIDSMEKNHNDRLKRMKHPEYSESLNWEADFLLRVKALFKEATEVHAIALSSVSDFWVSEKDKNLIMEYLRMQSDKKVHRIFVFQNPYEFAKYEDILNENYRSYGGSGGVYVTSSKYYNTHILCKFCSAPYRNEYLHKDFGVWNYKNKSLFATLKDSDLSYAVIDEDRTQSGINVKKFKESFMVSDYVYRWTDTSSVSNIAKSIFDDTSYAGIVVHIVLFKSDQRDLQELITQKINKLDDIQRQAISNNVSISFMEEAPFWGVNLQKVDDVGPFVDGKYSGILECDDEFQYALILKLPSIEDLRAWYSYYDPQVSHEDHSDIRKEIYVSLVDEVADLYAILDREKNYVKRVETFSKIEQAVKRSRSLIRMDFVFNKKLNDIVRFKLR